MITLAIDASTYVGTVAVLGAEGRVLSTAETAMRGADRERLMPAVGEALDRAGVSRARLDRIVCGGGPGSFTSLRIAASIAKGLAMGLGRPLYAVPSLALIAAEAAERPSTPARCLAVLDALRGERYVALYALDGTVRELAPARLVAAEGLAELAAERDATLVGPGQPFDVAPHARGLARVAEAVRPVDLAAWEPAYGRLAEAQVKWEAAHGRPLPAR